MFRCVKTENGPSVAHPTFIDFVYQRTGISPQTIKRQRNTVRLRQKEAWGAGIIDYFQPQGGRATLLLDSRHAYFWP